ncbi:HTH-type transcriptional regulator ZntR [Clostridium homopropionicum DSM 5847]|uniref:HTH-type transcriptional regulator ZntR n=1 Tax=Clostridium homopropionicum DSM 5847 TaxID=1121318 RepID=A0A0L6ZED3_9CLOT|nr:MerR family transcriptional regulator [Clostridium homopropionicum]KOA21330.1 HTH-type transcriptional regulator ZntR [Clostridium homopropionicum DSM 5847]SFG95938.1 transcriptional regulator, MerR family [Clostridium homopropionicum]
MDNQIKISDFVKLTRSTLKTVLYYHKIGLLQEPKRSVSGYRLYGAEELSRMRMIKHLKNLGLDLKQIKEILGDSKNHNINLSEVLKSLQYELLEEKKNIEIQLSKIEALLKQQTVLLEKATFGSEAFQIVAEILEPVQVKNNDQSSSELFEQRSNMFGILEDFQWGEGYKENFRAIAEYFKLHPEQYEMALEFGKRLTRLKEMSEEDPEVETLAREGAEFIKSIPFLKEILYDKSGFGITYENLFNEMAKVVLSPAQMKHKKLIQKYLNYRPYYYLFQQEQLNFGKRGFYGQGFLQ